MATRPAGFGFTQTSGQNEKKDDAKVTDGKTVGSDKREFKDEQLNANKNVIGLQMGSNKGASEAGQNFGKSRAIID